MSRSISAGVFGAVIGLVAAVVGVLWMFQFYNVNNMHDSTVLFQNLVYINFEMAVVIGGFQSMALNNAMSMFTGLTVILALLLVTGLILVGVGLYGIGQVAGSAAGTVSLVLGTLGAILSAILLVMGVLAGGVTHTLASLWMFSNLYMVLMYAPPVVRLLGLHIVQGVPTVSTSLLWAGLLVAGVVTLLFGVTFLLEREVVTSGSLAVATGVILIIAGIFLWTGVIAAWLGFILMFVGLIMAAILFFQSRELA